MTKEEILAMEAGAELDDIVASKIMEWEQGGDEGEVWLDHCTDYFVTGRAPGSSDYYWKPSTDISAAWQIVEKMESLGYGHKHLEYSQRPEAGIAWMFMQPGRGIFEAKAKKAPEAICKAALLAKLETG